MKTLGFRQFYPERVENGVCCAQNDVAKKTSLLMQCLRTIIRQRTAMAVIAGRKQRPSMMIGSDDRKTSIL
ncbi:MAG: hypothetical protein UC390_00850 [Peptococcaceae bacterium]|nr:hypothetical protein [Peptococcaceae bacterium]